MIEGLVAWSQKLEQLFRSRNEDYSRMMHRHRLERQRPIP